MNTIEWMKPTLGGFCFAIVMYGVMAIPSSKDSPITGLALILVGATVWWTGRRTTTAYSPAAFGYYIFAVGTILMGLTFSFVLTSG